MATPLEKVFVTAQYYGDSGGSTQYWYWVQAIYPWGYGALSSNLATVTVLSLSHSNVVSLNWTPCPSASYYNVWRTTTSAAPTTGTSQCIATGYPTADGLVDNGIAGFTIAVGTAGPTILDTNAQKAADEKMKKEQEEEAKMSPAELQKKREDQAKKAAEDQKKKDEEAKKESDKAKKEQDELIKELDETQKAEDEKLKEDSDRAAKLNQLYNEKYQLPVRKTEAQKKADEAAKKEAEPQPVAASKGETHHENKK